MNREILRRPPAFQEYAADLMAREDIKLMPLAELGLLVRMRWAAWCNDTLPEQPALLARILGLPVSEVHTNLSEAVMAFFAPAKGYSERLECPELSAQMARLMEKRQAQSEAANHTNAKRNARRGDKRDAKRNASEKSRTEPEPRKALPPTGNEEQAVVERTA